MISGLDVDDKDEHRKLSLLLDDGTKVDVTRRYAMMHSAMIQTALENDEAANALPVRGISREIMEKIVQFMEHHANQKCAIPDMPLQDTDMFKVCHDRWDADFITRFGKGELYNLLNASNYLSMHELSCLGSAFLASKIKGQTIENIRAALQV